MAGRDKEHRGRLDSGAFFFLSFLFFHELNYLPERNVSIHLDAVFVTVFFFLLLYE